MNLRDFIEHQFSITYDYHMLYKIGVVLEISQYLRQNSCERLLLLVLLRI